MFGARHGVSIGLSSVQKRAGDGVEVLESDLSVNVGLTTDELGERW